MIRSNGDSTRKYQYDNYAWAKYPLPIPELPESRPKLPETEVPDPKFG
jgi:hypothetical protein